jgi:peroxiredoxin
MKVRSSIVPLVAALLVSTVGAYAGDLAIGGMAPMADMKMKNVDGKETSIGAQKGAKGTLVIFTCNHCPFAKGWEERIVALGNTYSAKGIGVIAVNSNDPAVAAEDGFEQMQDRAKERGMQFAYVVDSTSGVAKAFGATRTPEAFLFDKSGKLVYHGTIDDNMKEPEKVTATYLKDALESVSNGQDVAVKETKALCCGIKFRG